MKRRRLAATGLSCIEALIALLVLSLGLLELGRLMARQLAEARNSNAHAIAVQHIAALQESMALNRPAALADAYALAWGGNRVATLDCDKVACDAGQRADHDLAGWRKSLRAALPSADARVFRAGAMSDEIGIAVAWPANERAMTPADAARQSALLDVTLAGSGTDCPATKVCHVVYARP